MRLRVICKSKIHHAVITGADLNYVGSIGIDTALMQATEIVPGERVRIWDALQRPDNLTRVDRQLFERLQTLTESSVRQATGSHLTHAEVTGVLKRRDRLVQHFQHRIEALGEQRVLY